MKCKGLFYNNINCGLCKRINDNVYEQCILIHEKKKENEISITQAIELSTNCIHRTVSYNEYEKYEVCKITKGACRMSKECLKVYNKGGLNNDRG